MGVMLALALALLGGISQITYGANLYPFGTAEGDELIPKRKDYGIEIASRDDFEFPFLGRNTGHLYIANNGYIAFTKTGHAFKSTKSWTNPNPKWPVESDPCFLAPFYAENHLTSTDATEPGSVFYRVLKTMKPKQQNLLRNITREVKENMVTARNFVATQGLVVTWFNLTFSGHFCPSQAGCPPRNTFQAILLSDSKESYVIFKYAQLTWLGGPSYGGDTATGLNAHFFPQAGFNTGDGLGWYPLPKSGTKDILDLVNMVTSSEESGSFYYKVSSDEVVPGGCLEKSEKTGLVAFPEHGSMLGGQLVELSGPCFKPSATVLCKFDDRVVKGEYVSKVKVRCVQPMFMKIGVVSLALSTDGGKEFQYTMSYTLVPIGQPQSAITIGRGFDMMALDWGQITLTWPTWEATVDSKNVVDVKLFGYSQASATPLHELQVIATRINNTGQYTFKLSKHRCHTYDCDLYELGIFQVSTSGISELSKPKLWSNVIPLSWNVGAALEKCKTWHDKDRTSMEWLDELDSCPCNVKQVEADFGRWRVGRGCNMYLGTPCRFHVGAVHCVNSVFPKRDGAGNQCCYGKDGLLMYAADSNYGSTPDRAFGLGAKPYGRHPFIPIISHWVLDVIPFIHCCLWSKGSCSLYMDQRPTRDCKGYVPPRQGMMYGDPHLMRFDGSQYSINGIGHYWLVKTSGGNYNDLQIQVRLERAIVEGKRVNVTKATAIALRDGSSSVVEVRLRAEGRNYIRKLDIIVDGAKQYFDFQFKDFQNVTIFTGNEYINITHGNITVMFESGVGVQVAAHDSLLHAVVSLPPSYKGKVDGLLGTWDDDIDYILAIEGSFDDLNETNAAPYQLNGLSWKVNKDQSLFAISPGKTFESYQDDSFLPETGEPPLPLGVTAEDIDALCLNNTSCIYDYKQTRSRNIAANTKQASDWFMSLRKFTTQIQTCGLLKVKNGLKDNYNYSIGNKVKITGCRDGHRFEGERDYECVKVRDVLQWIPQKTARCISMSSTGAKLVPEQNLFLLSMAVAACTAAIHRR
ncbi:uncharacterized protein K03H1.5-like [Lineus longissimus]|uniref:uncharacterized protein K03H1.5-like n=1 Tax=Lineus longissimus TaxID=88925 RepID=UPI002B4CC06E